MYGSSRCIRLYSHSRLQRSPHAVKTGLDRYAVSGDSVKVVTDTSSVVQENVISGGSYADESAEVFSRLAAGLSAVPVGSAMLTDCRKVARLCVPVHETTAQTPVHVATPHGAAQLCAPLRCRLAWRLSAEAEASGSTARRRGAHTTGVLCRNVQRFCPARRERTNTSRASVSCTARATQNTEAACAGEELACAVPCPKRS